MQDVMLFSSAMMIGLMGSSHCLSMCGGIASAQSFSQGARQTTTQETERKNHLEIPVSNNDELAINNASNISVAIGTPPSRSVLVPQLLTFNAGRIISYTFIGFLAGVIGATLALNSQLLVLLRTVAALMLILMGLYVGQWWQGLTRIEAIGNRLWQRLSPLASRLRQRSGLQATLLLGMLWGWLPCGLVFSALTWSMSSADPAMASLLMFGFGLGTLPSMLSAGLFAYQLRRLFSKLSLRRVFAIILILFGLWSLPVHWSQWMGDGHHAHSQINTNE